MKHNIARMRLSTVYTKLKNERMINKRGGMTKSIRCVRHLTSGLKIEECSCLPSKQTGRTCTVKSDKKALVLSVQTHSGKMRTTSSQEHNHMKGAYNYYMKGNGASNCLALNHKDVQCQLAS